jgi:hypothetical protein
VKSHSNLILADQFTAKIVGKREDHKEDADIKFKNLTLNVALDFIFHRNTIAVSPSFFLWTTSMCTLVSIRVRVFEILSFDKAETIPIIHYYFNHRH